MNGPQSGAIPRLELVVALLRAKLDDRIALADKLRITFFMPALKSIRRRKKSTYQKSDYGVIRLEPQVAPQHHLISFALGKVPMSLKVEYYRSSEKHATFGCYVALRNRESVSTDSSR